MDLRQIIHVLRAAAAITDQRNFVILGSQAVLVQYPNAPEEMRYSNEVDIYPLDQPDLADLIDGSIGNDSPFHATFGYFADGVGPETATLPEGWKERAVTLPATADTGSASAICPEIHDLIVSKLVAGRPKDMTWIAAAFQHGLARRETVAELLAGMKLDPGQAELVKQRLIRLSSSEEDLQP